MKYILLTDWAKKNAIPCQKAKDMARKGRLRDVAVRQEVSLTRWVIPENYRYEAKR